MKRVRIAADVAWIAGSDVVDDNHSVYLARPPDGRPAVLEGSAALAWLLVADQQPLVASLAEITGADAATIEADLGPFIDDLIDRGFLETEPWEDR